MAPSPEGAAPQGGAEGPSAPQEGPAASSASPPSSTADGVELSPEGLGAAEGPVSSDPEGGLPLLSGLLSWSPVSSLGIGQATGDHGVPTSPGVDLGEASIGSARPDLTLDLTDPARARAEILVEVGNQEIARGANQGTADQAAGAAQTLSGDLKSLRQEGASRQDASAALLRAAEAGHAQVEDHQQDLQGRDEALNQLSQHTGQAEGALEAAQGDLERDQGALLGVQNQESESRNEVYLAQKNLQAAMAAPPPAQGRKTDRRGRGEEAGGEAAEARAAAQQAQASMQSAAQRQLAAAEQRVEASRRRAVQAEARVEAGERAISAREAQASRARQVWTEADSTRRQARSRLQEDRQGLHRLLDQAQALGDAHRQIEAQTDRTLAHQDRALQAQAAGQRNAEAAARNLAHLQGLLPRLREGQASPGRGAAEASGPGLTPGAPGPALSPGDHAAGPSAAPHSEAAGIELQGDRMTVGLLDLQAGAGSYANEAGGGVDRRESFAGGAGDTAGALAQATQLAEAGSSGSSSSGCEAPSSAAGPTAVRADHGDHGGHGRGRGRGCR